MSLPVKRNHVYIYLVSQGYHVNKSYVHKVLCFSSGISVQILYMQII